MQNFFLRVLGKTIFSIIASVIGGTIRYIFLFNKKSYSDVMSERAKNRSLTLLIFVIIIILYAIKSQK